MSTARVPSCTSRPRPEPARDSDRGALAALQVASWRATYRGILPDAVLGSPLHEAKTRDWAGRRLDDRCLVLRDGGEMIGFAGFDPDRDEGLFLDNLHVRPGSSGRGHGACLMAAVARRAGARTLWLDVFEANRATRAIYRRWGGQEGAVFDNPILGLSVPARRVTWPDARALAARLEGRLDRPSAP